MWCGCVASEGIEGAALFRFLHERALRQHSTTTTTRKMASLVNGSFASPLADANLSLRIATEGGWLAKVYNGMSGLNVLISFLLVLVAYDQCELTA